MATNVTVRFAGDTTRLKKATQESQTLLGKFQKNIQGVFGGTAIAGLAKGAGWAAAAGIIANSVGKATMAYYDDIKAQKLLEAQIKNVTGASTRQMKAIDDQIQSLSLAAAVSDDVLRPAMAQLTQSTGSTEKALRLLALATDISAGTSKDLQSVSMALGKAFNGNVGSLKKLGISIKNTSNFTAELEARYKGLAETAAKNDPLGRMSIAMEQVQERVGAAFAPLIEQFAEFMSSPAGKAFLDTLVSLAQLLGSILAPLMTLLQPIFTILQPILKLATAIFSIIGSLITRTFDWIASFAEVPWINYLLENMVKSIDRVGQHIDKIMRLWAGSQDIIEYAPSTSQVVADALAKQEQDQADLLAQQQKDRLDTAAAAAETAAANTANRLRGAADRLLESGKNFKDSINFAFGFNEDKTFSVEKFMAQTAKIVAAAKQLPNKLKALRKQGASDEVISNILAQGPEAGNAIATGFLKQGGVKGYADALKSLDVAGQNAGGVAMANNNTYSININKANMTAEEIIAVIKAYEKKTGKQVVFGG